MQTTSSRWNTPRDSELLRAFIAAARASWPGIGVSDEAFIAWLERVVAEGQSLAERSGADLFLVCGCLLGDAGALHALEQRVLPRLVGTVAQVDASEAFIDEVLQELRTRLLVGPTPRLANFTGQGSLVGWLKTTSARLAIDAKRAERPRSDDDTELTARAVTHDLVGETFKKTHAPTLNRALEEALTGLEARDRQLLRLHFVERQSVDRIGDLYGVHRATAARWVVAQLEAHGVPAEDVGSFVRALESQVDLSLGAQLT
jgi:RNA polymerase sigma-70 factor (ECF subfamily)